MHDSDYLNSLAFENGSNLQKHMEHIRQERDEVYHDRNPVIKACEALTRYVQTFEKKLNEEEEIGVRLVSFGSEMSFHVEQIGFSRPNIVTFYGITESGEQLQLVQHVSQLSFLLMAVRKTDEKPRRIGFIWDD